MRKVVLILIFSLLLLILGRNLSFLPKLDFRSDSQKTEELKNKVQEIIKKQKGFYSIYYKDLKTGKSFGIDENKVLTGASLNKLVVVSYLYSLAKDKKIDLEEKVVVQPEDVQDYGTGSLRYEEPGKAYSLKTLAKLSLNDSDNTAAHVIAVKVGMDKIEEFAKKINLSSTNMVDNKTTAYDMGKIMEDIYNKKITSSPLTLELLDYLTNTQFEDRIPRYLKTKTDVYHKTADAVGMVHDVGIIDNKIDPFILSILTNDVEDEAYTKEVIGEIAKTIYEGRNK